MMNKPISLNSVLTTKRHEFTRIQNRALAAVRISLSCPPKFQPWQDVFNALKLSASISVNPRLKKVFTLPFSLSLNWQLRYWANQLFSTPHLTVHQPISRSASLPRLFLYLCLFVSISGSLFSALVFENPTVEIPPNPSLKEWVADYPFKNTGNKPVTILDVRPCCNCTVPKFEKKTYASGESGKLSLIFKTEGKTGIQEKHAVVITNDGAVPQVIFLKGRIFTLYDYLTLTPSSLRWNKGEEHKAKSIQIQFKEPYQSANWESLLISKNFRMERKCMGKNLDEIWITPMTNETSFDQLQLNFKDPLSPMEPLMINLRTF